jgi:anti-anti-sigma factor
VVVNFEFLDDVCVLRLEGRFATGQDAEYLRTKTEELKKQGCLKIIADFSGVSYIDSTGIGFLIAIYTSVLRERGGKFVIAAPNRRVREVLQLTKLDTILTLYDSVETAVKAMK